LVICLGLLLLVLGSHSATTKSFSAFPETSVTDVSTHALNAGSDIFFTSNQETTTSIHKMTVDQKTGVKWQSVVIESQDKTQDGKSSNSISALASNFDAKGLTALALKSGEVVIFDEDLTIHSVFTIPIAAKDDLLVCTGLVFDDSTLTCFANGTIVSLSIVAPKSENFWFSLAGQPSNTNLTIQIQKQFNVKWNDIQVSEITNAVLTNGYFYFVTRVLSAFQTTRVMLVFKVKQDFSDVMYNTLGWYASDISSLSLKVLPGSAEVLIFSMKALDSPDAVEPNLSINVVSSGQLYSKVMYIDEDSYASTSSATFITSPTEFVAISNDKIHQLKSVETVEETWAKRMVSNNCADFRMSSVVPVGSTYWILGHVHSPSSDIPQKSFLQVLQMTTDGVVSSNDESHNFYISNITDSWHESKSRSFAWESTKLIAVVRKSTVKEVSTLTFSKPVASLPVDGSLTAIKPQSYLLPTTVDQMEAGVSISGIFDDSLTVLTSGLDWLKITGQTIAGRPEILPTDEETRTLKGDLFGVCSKNPLLGCSRVPIIVETVENNRNGDSFSRSILSDVISNANVEMAGTINGDIMFWIEGYGTQFVASRFYSTGKANDPRPF